MKYFRKQANNEIACAHSRHRELNKTNDLIPN